MSSFSVAKSFFASESVEASPVEYDSNNYMSTSTGNHVSRKSILCGPQNIHLHGKTIIREGAVLRGDLATIRIGRNCIIHGGAVVRPGYKRYKGGFAFVPMQIGEYVVIGNNSVIEAAAIGTNVVIGNNVIIGRRAIIKDCTVIKDNTVIVADTVVPPFTCFHGIPGKIVNHDSGNEDDGFGISNSNEGMPGSNLFWKHSNGAELSASTPELIQEYVKKLYDAFQAKEPETY